MTDNITTIDKDDLSDRAAELYAASVREEAYRDGFGQGVHEGNDRALEPCLQDYLKRTTPVP